MMRGLFKTRRQRSESAAIAIADLGIVLAMLILSGSNLFAVESPSPRLIRCGRDEAETVLTFAYQLPGSALMRQQLYSKRYKEGDGRRPMMGPSKVVDEMGTETTTQTVFGDTEVTFTINQVPGPDRLNPYQVVIHAPFRRNVAGTTDGTSYEVTWNEVPPGANPSDLAGWNSSPSPLVPSGHAEPIINSVPISAKELMMLPHDERLAFDIQSNSETGSGAWIRFQSKGPTGEIDQIFRIQLLDDSGGRLGTAEVAESEVNAVSAPYLPNSLEKRCEVHSLKRASGNVYYCLLSNAAFLSDPTPPARRFRKLFVGVFRVGGSVALVVGNFSQEDDLSFRMMMETLARISTLPIVTRSGLPEPQGKKENIL